MATWEEIAQENFAAVVELVSRHWRSAVNRAYYAAYARIVAELQKAGVVFPTNREGPSHAKLPGLVETHLMRVGQMRWRVSELSRGLYSMRLIADYRPSEEVGDGDAREAVRMMRQVFVLMKRIRNGDAIV